MVQVARYAKAVYASLGSGLLVLYVALDDGGLSAQEWVAIAIAVLGIGGGTAAIKNKPRTRS